MREFSTGALRDDDAGKGRYDLVPVEPLRRLAVHYQRGAEKYGEDNWRKGIPRSSLMDSALRHLQQYHGGDRREDHLAAAAWNVFAMMEFEDR